MNYTIILIICQFNLVITEENEKIKSDEEFVRILWRMIDGVPYQSKSGTVQDDHA